MIDPYIVQAGECISDVVINATGTLANLDAILTANNFDTWTPILTEGQEIIIPDGLTNDPNAQRQFVTYPVCNSSVSNVYDQISDIFETMNDFWILTTTFWNDIALWKDDQTWTD